ncbi:MAG: tol-pal system protein YbgF [Alphaproteobacteria bacterium]|nr:tol-pal system protein YbgF [Alphaproteobacteria bacterium]
MKRILYCTIALSALLLPKFANAATMEQELQNLREDVKVLQRQLYRENTKTSPENSEVQGKIGEYDEAIRKLNGRMDELEHQLKANDEKIERYNRDMEIRLKILEGRPIPSELSAPAPNLPTTYAAPVATNAAASVAGERISGNDLAPLDGEPVAVNEPASIPVAVPTQIAGNLVNTNDAQTMYDNALRAYNTGYYDEAELAFSDILSRFPQNALASNAQYWLGEIYLKRGNLSNAKVAFKKGYESYKNGNKGADSLYRLATTFEAMNDTDHACLILTSFEDEYPSGHAEIRAKVISERLKLKCK